MKLSEWQKIVKDLYKTNPKVLASFPRQSGKSFLAAHLIKLSLSSNIGVATSNKELFGDQYGKLKGVSYLSPHQIEYFTGALLVVDDPAFIKSFTANSVIHSAAKRIIVLGTPRKDDEEFKKLILTAPEFIKILFSREDDRMKDILGPTYPQEIQGLF